LLDGAADERLYRGVFGVGEVDGGHGPRRSGGDPA
jgi:hypothetical protein